MPKSFFVVIGSASVAFLTDLQAIAGELVIPDSLWVQQSSAPLVASDMLALTTHHVGGALLAVMTAAVAFWQVRELRLRKRIQHLEEALVKTSRELSAAHSANEGFLSNISHDLRNPICGIFGLTKALEDTSLDAAQRRLTGSIRSCVSVLSTLIDDLLDFAKLRTGEIELTLSSFELKACIEDVVTMAKGSEIAQASVSVAIADDLPKVVYGDRARLQQIVLNFLSNAHKFGAGKAVALSVEGHPDATIRVSVRDQGYGLSQVETALLFNRFATLHSDHSLRGTGMGLATCRVLAEKMGGTVGVESTVGEGSCFWVQLPLRESASEPVANQSASPFQNASALVVEDIEYSAAATVAMLRSLGFRAESVSDGPTASMKLEQSQYDLVLMDWNIPGLAGTEVAARFRAREDSSHTTIIIATTAYSAERNRDACLAAGMNAFIAKPLTPEKIAAELRRLGRSTRLRVKLSSAENIAQPIGSGLDLQILEFLSDGSPESLIFQLARYQTAFESDLASAHDVVRSGDVRQIASIAHRLISHAAAIKCASIVELAGKLQRHADVLSDRERHQLLNAIDREFIVLKGKLAAFPVSTRPD